MLLLIYQSTYVPSDKNYLLFFDNWFTSIGLLKFLQQKAIYGVGTVRVNRLPGIGSLLESDKALEKKEEVPFRSLRQLKIM